jgi:hypothetical protein
MVLSVSCIRTRWSGTILSRNNEKFLIFIRWWTGRLVKVLIYLHTLIRLQGVLNKHRDYFIFITINVTIYLTVKKFKGKTIPVTDCGGPLGCETSRLPHFLDNWLADDGEVVRLTRRPPFTPTKNSWYSFLLEAESTPGPKCGKI